MKSITIKITSMLLAKYPCALLSLNNIAITIVSHLRISYTQTKMAILLYMFANQSYIYMSGLLKYICNTIQ